MSDLDYLGGIDYSEFVLLQDEKIIEPHFDYFEDFRWTSEQVKAKLVLLEELDAKRYGLIEILRKAKEQKCGVIAYCD